jgi:hypothetical protein
MGWGIPRACSAKGNDSLVANMIWHAVVKHAPNTINEPIA